jgi:hypothetical protein
MLDDLGIDEETLANLTDAEVDELRLLAEKRLRMQIYDGDCDEWLHEFLPKQFPLPSPAHRKDDFDRLSNPIRGKRMAIAEPREHAKTTTYSVGYPLYAICEGHHNYVLIISSTADHAKNIMKTITYEVEQNEKLRARYPFLEPLKDRKGQNMAWHDKDLIFGSRQRVSAYGKDAKLRGLNSFGVRPTLIIVDDAESGETVRTSYQRMGFAQIMTQIVFNLGSAEGHDILFMGTVLHPESFLARLVSNDEFSHWHKSLRQAVVNWETGQTLWPEKWTFEKLLLKQREIGERDFAQEFQNVPCQVFQEVFNENILKFYPANLMESGRSMMAGWRRFGAVDPSMGKEHGDFSGLIVGAIDPQKRLHILDWQVERLVPTALGRRIEELSEKWQCQFMGFEANTAQAVFLELFKSQNINVHFKPVINLLSKKNRIDALEIPIVKGDILFDPNWKLRRDSYPAAMRQLFSYNGREKGEHDDGPDVLALLRALQVSRDNSVMKVIKWAP